MKHPFLVELLCFAGRIRHHRFAVVYTFRQRSSDGSSNETAICALRDESNQVQQYATSLAATGTHTHRRRKGSVVGGHHGECGARAYNRGLGAEPPAGSRGRAPGQERSPREAESILVIGCPTEPANLAPFQKSICISTLGATVMIWEKFLSKFRGSGDRPCPFLGAPMTQTHTHTRMNAVVKLHFKGTETRHLCDLQCNNQALPLLKTMTQFTQVVKHCN